MRHRGWSLLSVLALVLLAATPALAGGGGGGGGVRSASVPWISMGFLAVLQLGVAVWWWQRRRR